MLSDWILTGDSASYEGGGAYNGTLYNCTLTDNSLHAGGGAYDGTLYNCTLTANSACYGGAGIGQHALQLHAYRQRLPPAAGRLRHALQLHAHRQLGFLRRRASDGTFYNCTLTGNSAYSGGGAFYGTLYNCIVYYNEAVLGANYD